MKKKNIYNIIIIVSTFLAIVCLAISGLDYLESKNNQQESKENQKVEETIEAPTESIAEEPEIIEEEIDIEPLELQTLDKKSVIKKHLDDIYDEITIDPTISNEMIKTWNKYEVIDVRYIKEVKEYYYSYDVDLKIAGVNISFPTAKNEILSTDEYTVITLNMTIIKSGKQNGYVVKSIIIP